MIFRLIIIFNLILLLSCRSLVNTFDSIEEGMYFKASNISESDFFDSLKVMTWNIRFGGGRIAYFGDSCGDRSLMTEDETVIYLDKIINHINNISKPDILLFQEIDLSSKRSAYLNQIQYILDKTYFNYAAYGSNWDVNFVPSDGIGKVNMGNAIFSRWKIKDAERIKLALRTDQKFYVQYGYLRRNILRAKIVLPNDQDIYAVNIHATAFATDDTKQKHIDKYKEVLDEINDRGEYFITGGDLNSLPPNAEIIDFCLQDMCDGDEFHSENSKGPYHREGSYFNNFEGEPDLVAPFYLSYYSAIDTALVNNPEHLTHSPWNDSYTDLESESWDRKLDYLFTNYQNWTSTGNTDNTISKTSDHAPVTAILYFNQ
jgi:endonuclease/exonuclease/phosphatase family metal-dependent hydrolase